MAHRNRPTLGGGSSHANTGTGLTAAQEAWGAYMARTGHTVDPLVAEGGHYGERTDGQQAVAGLGPASHLFIARNGGHAGEVGAVVEKAGRDLHVYYTQDGHRVVVDPSKAKPMNHSNVSPAAVKAYINATANTQTVPVTRR